MLRIPATERPDLERVAKEHNFEFKANGGIPFWDESIYYQFTLKQIEEDLEAGYISRKGAKKDYGYGG